METPGSSREPAPTSTITVAVVEDDVSTREMLETWLHGARGFTGVAGFPDAESAIADMARVRPNIALVDINLPGQSGIECVRTLKPQLPETQFVMLTVYEDATRIFDALTAGATGYLLKRTPREALFAALLEVHSGGSPMTSSIARKVVQAFQHPEPKSRPVDRLSNRESEVLSLLARGYLYKEIAEAMEIGLPTVNSYVRRVYEKLQVRSRGQAVAVYADLCDDRR